MRTATAAVVAADRSPDDAAYDSSPEYPAANAEPDGAEATAQDALDVGLATGTAEHPGSVDPPSMKATTPPSTRGVTVAVSVTGWPATIDPGELLSVSAVGTLVTVAVGDEVAGAGLPTPLVAVTRTSIVEPMSAGDTT